MVEYTTSLKDVLDITLKELGYTNNPRKCELVKYILYHIEKMNVDPFAYEVFPETNGARKYIVDRKRENLLREIIETTNCFDLNFAIQKYAIMYSNNLLEQKEEAFCMKR